MQVPELIAILEHDGRPAVVETGVAGWPLAGAARGAEDLVGEK